MKKSLSAFYKKIVYEAINSQTCIFISPAVTSGIDKDYKMHLENFIIILLQKPGANNALIQIQYRDTKSRKMIKQFIGPRG